MRGILMPHPATRLGPKNFHVYCDESHTDDFRYTVYGGIVTAANSVEPFNEAVSAWRAKNHYMQEIKWKKCGAESYYKTHVGLVDFVFEHIQKKHIDFKAVVFDARERQFLKDKRNKDKNFYRLYYKFLFTKFAPYARSDDRGLYIYLDKRTTKYNFGTLYNVLNNAIVRDTKRTKFTVRIVEPRESKETNLIQLADLLMGAIGFQCNGQDQRPDAAQPKVNLARYIAKKAGLRSLTAGTSRFKADFNIWRFKSHAAIARETQQTKK
jgi:hypothetical protein